jgi:DNA-binding transcriptional ArsR family regulator
MPQQVPRRRPAEQFDAGDDRPEQPAPEELLALLGDDIARQLLRHVAEEPLPASVLADRLDVARSTVYGRLDRLEAAGLVDGAMSYHPEEHHRRRFAPRLDELRVSLDGGDLQVALATPSQAV